MVHIVENINKNKGGVRVGANSWFNYTYLALIPTWVGELATHHLKSNNHKSQFTKHDSTETLEKQWKEGRELRTNLIQLLLKGRTILNCNEFNPNIWNKTLSNTLKISSKKCSRVKKMNESRKLQSKELKSQVGDKGGTAVPPWLSWHGRAAQHGVAVPPCWLAFLDSSTGYDRTGSRRGVPMLNLWNFSMPSNHFYDFINSPLWHSFLLIIINLFIPSVELLRVWKDVKWAKYILKEADLTLSRQDWTWKHGKKRSNQSQIRSRYRFIRRKWGGEDIWNGNH